MMFVHLHVHSHFSFGQGPSHPETLIAAARARGFTTLACTDTNGVYGAVDFQRAAEAEGIRPILGAHLAHGGEECVALAEDEKGWGRLCRVISAIHWDLTPRPPLHPERAERGSSEEDVRGSFPSPSRQRWRGGQGVRLNEGESRLSNELIDRAGLSVLSSNVTFLERLAATSGTDGLYVELRPGKERHQVLAAADRLGVPPVATGAVMFANPEEWKTHRLLTAVAANTALSAIPISSLAPRDAWLRPADEIARHFPDRPDALTRAEEIAERCRYRIPIGRTVPPRLQDLDAAFQRLRALAYEGAAGKYGEITTRVRDRLEHELAIIGQKEFADYFLVVHDIVKHGPKHCGRGSVANSIVSYSLGITHVEPLAAGLLFERFLNPERKDPPDIDLDFPWDERDKVFDHVFRKYPHPRAAMVANHNSFQPRGALRAVAITHGRPPGEVSEITRRFPWFAEGGDLPRLMREHPNFRSMDLAPHWFTLAKEAESLLGIPRHLSLHPGGVVIAPSSLHDFVPTQIAAKELDGFPDLPVPVIQFEKDGAEDAGLVKIDLLGNRSLAVIRDGIEAVRVHTGKVIDYTADDPASDEKTREVFRTGETMGVFYTESPASRQLCAKSRADDFELLVLNTSIIRPASNKYIRKYLERLHGDRRAGHPTWEPLHESLRKTLQDTYGIMVYQEDVVNVCADYAGMTLAAGDGVRKALSKKRPGKLLASYQEEFFAGAAALGRPLEVTREVWHMVLSFAGYSFCKGHSCSYIKVALHSGYLRANHPAEFISAVLANGGGFYRPFAYVAEARRMGLRILPPDINASRWETHGHDDWIRIGFQFVSGLSRKGETRLEEIGRSGGPAARDLEDLSRRIGLSREDIRVLVKVGACDSIANGRTRPQMLWAIDAESTDRSAGEQLTAQPPSRPTAPLLPEYTPDRRRRTEYELLGFVTDHHPMALYADQLSRLRVTRSTEMAQHIGQTVVMAGMLTTAKPVRTVHDEPMEFATFDDGHGLIETVLFPKVYERRVHLLFDQGPFLLHGKVEVEFGVTTLTVTDIERVERLRAAPSVGRPVRVPRNGVAR
jgi:error-prone DNA polymerase